ncbi:MAG: proline iminopeptidase-family hydrolase [Methanomicrobiales archaeon]|mgnify:CR=1 FL=1|nr:proline iminopeptidase-family hydrolase [Methanomicrobiales archaeon]
MTDDTREGFIEVNSWKIWFRIDGAKKPKTPLLIIHGGPGFPHDYLLPLKALSSERPVIWYDQLGCGYSDKPDFLTGYTLEYYVRELTEIREKLDLLNLHILGQSWGTMLAVEYLITQQPPGVNSLILSAPCLSVSRWHNDQRQYIEELPSSIRNTILKYEELESYDSPEYQEAMNEFYRRHLCRSETWPECLMASMEKLGHSVYEYMWGPSEFTIKGTLRTYERAQDLPMITVPTLFTCGRYDEASPESTRHYQSMLPGSQLVIFEDAAHAHHLEQRTTYIETIRKFLTSVDKNE